MGGGAKGESGITRSCSSSRRRRASVCVCVCEVLKRGGESNSGYLVQLGCPLLCSSLLLFFFFSFFTPLPHLSHLASSSSNAYNFHIFSTFPHNGKRHLTQLQQTLISCGKCIHNFLCNTHACNILQGTQRGGVREREIERESAAVFGIF